jgi:hypothetical protein
MQGTICFGRANQDSGGSYWPDGVFPVYSPELSSKGDTMPSSSEDLGELLEMVHHMEADLRDIK